MPWFPGPDPQADPAEVRRQQQLELERQAQDQALLEQGRLPQAAQQRLAEIGRSGPEGLAFTSDLAPDEAGLLRRHGVQPVCLVTGSAMYHVGYASASAWNDCEVSQLSHAYNEATRLAVSRLQLEAAAARADGVLGVRYSIVRHEWADRTVEVQLIGTAVRAGAGSVATGQGSRPGQPDPLRPGAGAGGRHAPWLCDLSGQEWYALWRAGYEPAALAYGHCTWFILTTMQDEWNETSGVNTELRHFSEALGQCRTRAAMHLKTIARDCGALGVVGVHLARRLDEVRLTGNDENPAYEREHHNLILSLIGTAIRARAGAAPRVPATRLVLSLRDGLLEAGTTAAEARFV